MAVQSRVDVAEERIARIRAQPGDRGDHEADVRRLVDDVAKLPPAPLVSGKVGAATM